MENPKHPWLFALYNIRPFIEEYWDKTRGHPFVNNLPEILVKIRDEIEEILRTAPNQGLEFRLNDFPINGEDEVVTARHFLILLYWLRPIELSGRDGEKIPGLLNAAIDKAEEALLKHIARDVNRRASFSINGGAYRLRMSNIISTRTDSSGVVPIRKKNALFTIGNFLTELTAAKVPNFYYRRPDSSKAEMILAMYNHLPDSVKDSFFTVNFIGRTENQLPLYLAKDLFLFADNEQWARLKQACASDNKKEGTKVLTKFLQDFLEYERRNNLFKLGASTKNVSDSTYLSPKALAYLEICKPPAWIGRTVATTPEIEEEEEE